MKSTAHFYNPKDDSLDERIHAYKKAFLAWKNIEASFRFHDEQEWSDRLGSKEDLLKAKEITENSLDRATSGLSNAEIQLAIDKDLVSSQESEYLMSQQKGINNPMSEKEKIIADRKKEIAEIRKQEAKSHEHSKSKDNDFDKS
ncbi:MAG: hypothetical protein OCD00_19435 [Colwellia sp.]